METLPKRQMAWAFLAAFTLSGLLTVCIAWSEWERHGKDAVVMEAVNNTR